jgi:hypothetical protein
LALNSWRGTLFYVDEAGDMVSQKAGAKRQHSSGLETKRP